MTAAPVTSPEGRPTLRVLIYTHSFAPRIGGVETHVMLLAQGLSKAVSSRGVPVEVTIVTPTPGQGLGDSEMSFQVIRSPSPGDLWAAANHADVIHLAGPALAPLAIARSLRKALVVEHHGYQAVCPNGLLLHQPGRTDCPGHFMAGRYHECLRCESAEVGWAQGARRLALTFLRRRFASGADANVGVSDHVTVRIHLPRATTIRHGIEEPETSPEPEPPLQGLAPEMCLAYVGRLVGEKGLHLLMEATRRLFDEGHRFRVRLVGDGEERSALQRQARALGIAGQVEFLGFVRGASLETAMRGVTALVMPSVCEETAGLAAIEQMIRGRAVVVADIGGLAEYVGDAGLKFPSGDASALADCLRRLLTEPGLAEELGAAGRRRALAEFTAKRMVRQHLELYEAILAARSRGCR
jgi:glycosyltransferase involved in cell wall biosynthesis